MLKKLPCILEKCLSVNKLKKLQLKISDVQKFLVSDVGAKFLGFKTES